MALVIGNNAYPSMPLRNALNDARAMRSALTEDGFLVDHEEDTPLRVLARRVDEFAAKLRPGDTALFYYSGHGIQVDGKNYLVPTDFSAASESDVEYAAYPASRVQKKMEEKGSRLNILVLDACRDNPFRFGRSAAGGLAAMREGVGTLIAFAAAEGQKASDNPGQANGLFTMHLLEALRTPGLPLRDLFFQVQENVYIASQKRQFPYVYAGVVGNFYFRPDPRSSPPGAPVVGESSQDLRLRAELTHWESIKDSRETIVFEDYVRRYPQGQFAELAQSKLRGLRAAAILPPSPSVTQGEPPLVDPRYKPGYVPVRNPASAGPDLPAQAPPKTHLNVGDMAPDFDLPSTQGKKVKVSDFRGKKNVVLAFFPAAFTGGCTKEMSGYQVGISKFEGADTQVFGVSTDDIPSQAEFAKKLSLSFPLLSDFATRKMVAAYGVLMPDRGIANRATFVVNREGKIAYIEEGSTAIDISGVADACSRVARKN
jgi:peroxiredoxin